MSTLLTPIISQLEIDRDRLKVLINGENTETIQLENRVEGSIAKQVKDRIDGLAISLTDSVEAAEQAKDESTLLRNEMEGLRDQTVTAKDEAVVAKDEAVVAKDQTVTAKDQTETARDQTETARDQTVTAKDEAVVAKDEAVVAKDEAIAARDSVQEMISSDSEYLPRYETNSFEVDTIDQTIYPQTSTVWRLDGSQNWDLVFPDFSDPEGFTLNSSRSMTIVIFVQDSGGSITWPTEVSWAGGSVPELGTTWTNIVLFWTGTMWIGMESAKL